MTPATRGGPLAVRNQHPVQLTTLRMTPESARPLAAGAVEAGLEAAYSSLFLQAARDGNRFDMDAELLRVGLRGSYSPLPDLQLSLEVPVAHTSGGFLDAFLIDYHDTLGLEDAKRDESPRGEFGIEVQRDGQLAYRMEQRNLTLLDVPIEAMWRVYQQRGAVDLDLALRGAIELPTGDQDAGYGNGGIDYAIGALGEIAYGPFSLQAHIAHTFIATPDRAEQAGLEYRDGMSSGFGLEAALSEDLAVLVQLEMDQAVLRDLIGVQTESDQWLLWLGLRQRLADGVLFELSFGEDLTLNTGPDFTVYLGLRAVFGGQNP